MFKFILACTAFFSAVPGFGQSSQLEKDIDALESFMNAHIPAGHVSVTGYIITIDGCMLTKETQIDGGENHSVSYRLDGARIEAERLRLKGEEAKIYGFKTYWDVHIDSRWILSEMPVEKDVLELVALLQKIQSECVPPEEPAGEGAAVKKLEEFMNRHIPESAASVQGYEISVAGCVLTKTTLIGEDDDHSVSYRLDNADFTAVLRELNREEARIYGFKQYWDVLIDSNWLLDEIPVEKDAQELIGLLEKIQSECKTE